MQNVRNAFAASALLAATLAAWRLGFAHSDWVGLALVPIFAVLVIGTWDLRLSVWKAKAAIVIQPGSPVGYYLTGRIGAALRAVGFSTVSVIFLAWLGLGTSVWGSSMILAAFVVSAATYSLAQGALLRHVRRPFSDAWAASVATWWVAPPMIVIVGWLTWSTVHVDSALSGADLKAAIGLGLDRLPERSGFLSELLSWFFAYEYFKLWMVLQFERQPIVGIIYCLDTSLATLVACRAGAVTAYFLELRVFGTGHHNSGEA